MLSKLTFIVQFVIIDFKSFQIQYSSGCLDEHVTIYDGSNDSAPVLGTICEDNPNFPPDSLLASTADVYVVFESNLVNTPGRTGFEIELTSSYGKC